MVEFRNSVIMKVYKELKIVLVLPFIFSMALGQSWYEFSLYALAFWVIF